MSGLKSNEFSLMNCWQFFLAACITLAFQLGQSGAAKMEILDESRVPAYELPDPLVGADGARIKTADEWIAKRRPEILRLFESQVYGRAPKDKPQLRFQIESEDWAALGDKVIRREVTILVSTPRGQVPLHLL